jgi:hypothetical protein
MPQGRVNKMADLQETDVNVYAYLGLEIHVLVRFEGRRRV